MAHKQKAAENEIGLWRRWQRLGAERLGVVMIGVSALAPFQCSHRPDPNERHEDTPGDALWGLASEFGAQHNEAARSETLRYLIARYPSNRHAQEARAELAGPGGGAPTADGG